MLSKLIVHNVALIKHLELDFCDKLNILSGETGAGKSIIVDSLMLLLGARYDKNILRYGEDSGFVEGIFDITDSSKAVLSQLGFEDDDILIVNRKFNSDGKNEIRINGRVSTTLMLKSVTSCFVDIYGQNEYQSLTKNSEHLRILGYYVRHSTQDKLIILENLYKEYKKVCRELKEIGDFEERARNIDILKFQLDEIEKSAIYEGEENELLEKRKIISSAEKIITALNSICESLSGERNNSAIDLVCEAGNEASGISRYSDKFSDIYDRLESARIELEDISQTAFAELEGMDFDVGDLEKLEKRLELIRDLKRKYGDYSKMQEFYKKNAVLLDRLQNSSQAFEQLSTQKEKLIKDIYNLSLEISQIRKEGATEFESLIMKELADLGMPNSVFKIVFSDFPSLSDCESHITQLGMDKPEFYFSANAGQPLLPLIKIISGGELSRFMLALKVVSSRTDEIQTMIFDEIDTGISGMIGQAVAQKLAIISRSHQVLCVTHLPQIASMADNHYFISKQTVDNTTITNVSLLSQNGMIEEISRLSGAKDISEQSFENARQMKAWSYDFKNSLN